MVLATLSVLEGVRIQWSTPGNNPFLKVTVLTLALTKLLNPSPVKTQFKAMFDNLCFDSEVSAKTLVKGHSLPHTTEIFHLVNHIPFQLQLQLSPMFQVPATLNYHGVHIHPRVCQPTMLSYSLAGCGLCGDPLPTFVKGILGMGKTDVVYTPTLMLIRDG